MKPDLKLASITKRPRVKPPRALGEAGKSLCRIMSSYAITDQGGIELLYQCCAAADRAESLHKRINQDGETLVVNGIVKAHPALRDELAARSFIARTITRLGLDVEGVRSGPGRPGSGGVGITDWAI
jgi:hypothetical protein